VNNYDFKTLDDKEFEIFCADLLGDVEGVRFERFKAGKDKGVDGRYFSPDGQEVILQCKHWANTPLEKLISHLRTIERAKLERLEPTRYILAVSNPLSRTDKAAIVTALTPYIRTPSDVFGKEDLNDLLATRRVIEERHYKLWFSSTAVLSHIINKPIFDRSKFSLEEILDAAKRYVLTTNHDRALELLEKRHAVIITGEPGVGKTTLAEHICLHYVAQGFQFFKAVEDIHECESVFETDVRQVFYFDDFLGRNYLEALSGHEGNHIVHFIRRVTRDKGKRFILTSRSTILNQGKMLIDNFQQQNLDRNEFELKVSALSEMDRARILYSHIWHSGLDPEFVEQLYLSKRYRQIIAHKNFNPRLISFITDPERLSEVTPGDYSSYVSRTLRNPKDVWAHPFEAQQDDFGRAMVLLVTLNGGPFSQEALAESYARFSGLQQNQAMAGRRDFLSNLKVLTGSLLTRRMLATGMWTIDLFNPSIGDYVLRRYSEDLPALMTGFLSLRSSSSLETLLNLRNNQIINGIALSEILRGVMNHASEVGFVGFEPSYVALGMTELLQSANVTAHDQQLARAGLFFVIDEKVPTNFLAAATLVKWGSEFGYISGEAVAEFISEACGNNPNDEELSQLAALAEGLGPVDDGLHQVHDLLGKAALDYLIDNLHDEFEQSDIFEHVEYEDTWSAERNLRASVSDWLNRKSIKLDEAQMDEVVDAYDVGGELEKFYTGSSGERSYSGSQFVSGQIDEIDDLFDRS
jgi:adenylate kinase family enzyme